jgi:hypothetical protein
MSEQTTLVILCMIFPLRSSKEPTLKQAAFLILGSRKWRVQSHMVIGTIRFSVCDARRYPTGIAGLQSCRNLDPTIIAPIRIFEKADN